MFVAKRALQSTEQIQVGEKILEINLDPMRMALEFNKKYSTLLNARNIAKQGKAKDIDKLGEAAISLFKLVLGEANFEEIIAFYDGNYVEMVQQLAPFLNEVIVPKMCDGLIAVRNEAAAKNNLNKIQRLFLAGK